MLLDATSGTTGIVYNDRAALLSGDAHAPTRCGPQAVLKLYGAEIIETDQLNGMTELRSSHANSPINFPDKYFYADQYNNDANWRAHYESTAPETQQTNGRIIFDADCD